VEAARKLVEAWDRWLNPPELAEHVPEVVPGFPDWLLPRDAAAAAVLPRLRKECGQKPARVMLLDRGS